MIMSKIVSVRVGGGHTKPPIYNDVSHVYDFGIQVPPHPIQAGHTSSTIQERVGRRRNACFHTFSTLATSANQRTNQRTNRSTDNEDSF